MKESVKTVLELVDGLKTYITCAVILVLLMLHWSGKLVLPPEFYAGLGVLALAFLRAGVGKAGPVAVLALGALSLTLVGCGSVAPGSDPVVVYAERTTLVSMDTIDTFLRYERANEAALGAKVHDVAESLRKQAPAALRSARSATKTYKANRNADNKATLETALAVLKKLADDALAATPKPAAELRSPRVAMAVMPAGVLLGLEALAAILGLIAKERERLRQNGELTVEQDAQIDEEVETVLAGEHWKPGKGAKEKNG
jgi:hypothetical protein